MSEKVVTILVPHYKSLKLTKLCLRLLKTHTDLSRVHVIVLDNGSKDESTEYLKTVDWIELMIIDPGENFKPADAHSKALNKGLAKVTTPYVLSIHNDTFMRNADWLDFLLAQIERDDKIAGVGSWKLEEKPLYKRFFKALEGIWQPLWFKLRGKKDHRIVGKAGNFKYLRSHCALYRTDILRKLNLDFLGEEVVAGKSIQKGCVENGYDMIFLPSPALIKYMYHVNHATLILNPELGAKQKTISKGMKRLKQVFKELRADELLACDDLDRA